MGSWLFILPSFLPSTTANPSDHFAVAITQMDPVVRVQPSGTWGRAGRYHTTLRFGEAGRGVVPLQEVFLSATQLQAEDAGSSRKITTRTPIRLKTKAPRQAPTAVRPQWTRMVHTEPCRPDRTLYLTNFYLFNTPRVGWNRTQQKKEKNLTFLLV